MNRILGILLCSVIAIWGCSDHKKKTVIDKDLTAPTALFSPAASSRIKGDTSIVVKFNETIDTNSIQIKGVFGNSGNSYTIEWSSDKVDNDTLSLVPVTPWPEGDNQVLELSAADMAGNTDQFQSAYQVDNTPPTAIPQPANNSTVGAAQALIIEFDEIVDTATIALSGSLVEVSTYRHTWSNDPIPSLTITPTGNWQLGENVLHVDIDDLVGNSMATLSLTYKVDGSKPTLQAQPLSGSILTNSGQVDILFSEAVKQDSLAIGGNLMDDSVPVWLSDTHLVIKPVTAWQPGAGKNLILAVDDIYGNNSGKTVFFYDVATIHVSNGGDDTKPGTRAEPKATIQDAIQTAADLYEQSEVLVQQGLYPVNSDTNPITLANKVSVRGSFSADWSTQDRVLTPSRITDEATAGDVAAPNKTIVAANVFSETDFNGFWVQGANTPGAKTIYVQGSPNFINNRIEGRAQNGSQAMFLFNSYSVIRNNDIVGTTHADAINVTAIYVTGSNPLIEENNIKTHTASPNTESTYGIYHWQSISDIRHNTILLEDTITTGNGITFIGAPTAPELAFPAKVIGNIIRINAQAKFTRGIQALTSTADEPQMVLQSNSIYVGGGGQNTGIELMISNGGTIGHTHYVQNNTVHGGEGTGGVASALMFNTKISLDNNILFASRAGSRCINDLGSGTDIAYANNNVLFTCDVPYYDADAQCTLANQCTITEMETLADGSASGNFTVDPKLIDGGIRGYQLGVDTPLSVREGGLNLSAQQPFPFDLDQFKHLRDAPWSIGSHEYFPAQ